MRVDCPTTTMPHVPGLRSCYAKVGRIVMFGRCLDKIRLHAKGQLPADYVPNLGDDKFALFDSRLCRFLGVPYSRLRAKTLEGGTDEQILAWCEETGKAHTDEECMIWNHFIAKLGWRDNRTEVLKDRVKAWGQQGLVVETIVDNIEYDEGRDPVGAQPWSEPSSKVVMIMGVAGCGKTTVGARLAQDLGWGFRDADDFHPPENVAKMAAGLPLNDEDRAPWLEAIRAYVEAKLMTNTSAVVTCSALKEKYRTTVLPDPSRVKLVHLNGDYQLILERISQRQGHFMKDTMLKSQFEALEAPKDALTLDVANSPEALVGQIRKAYGL